MTPHRFALPILAALLTAVPAVAAEETTAQVIAALELREGPTAVRDMPGWTKPQKVVVFVDNAHPITWFQDVVKGVTLVPARNPQEAIPAMADADAVMGSCAPAVVNAGGAKLKYVHAQQVGVEDCVTVANIAKGGVLLSNSKRVNGPNISEHAMALLLALSRQLNVTLANQREGKWDSRSLRGVFDISGKTILINGLGGIGTDVAERAHAFGMKVIATRASSREGPAFVSRVGLPNELAEMITQADVVVNTAPITAETRNLFNAAMFDRMKQGAYFINVARGESVVTDDLVAAIKSGKLAGVGLDVTSPEPLPPGHPLWSLPNVIITPHSSAISDLKVDRAWAVTRENLRRFVAGEKLLSLVDVKRGY